MRFIPTFVGNFWFRFSKYYVTSVHPHIRGELLVQILQVLRYLGSSPHSWGTSEKISPSMILNRFIPTFVGNLCWTNWPALGIPVHPHIRGELTVAAGAKKTFSGSSPHSWGTFQKTSEKTNEIRFIPTFVGNFH